MIEPKHKLSIIVSFEGLKTVIHKVDDAYDTLSHSLLSEKNQDPDDKKSVEFDIAFLYVGNRICRYVGG